MSKYPQHEKLKKVQDQSQMVGEFLEWLSSKSWTICELNRTDDYCPIQLRTEELLAEYFGIDLKKLEREKRAMLDELREKQEAIEKFQEGLKS